LKNAVFVCSSTELAQGILLPLPIVEDEPAVDPEEMQKLFAGFSFLAGGSE